MSNEIEELGMIDMNAVNQLMTTNEITKLVPLTQYYTNLRGKKSVCPVQIHPIDNLLTRLRTSFRINKRSSRKYNTQMSTINKISLKQIA